MKITIEGKLYRVDVSYAQGHYCLRATEQAKWLAMSKPPIFAVTARSFQAALTRLVDLVGQYA